MAENECSKLRVDAPIFTPSSFGNHKHGKEDQTVPANHYEDLGDKNVKHGRLKRNRRRPQKRSEKADRKNAKSLEERRKDKQDMSQVSSQPAMIIESQDSGVVRRRGAKGKKARGRMDRRIRGRQRKRSPLSIFDKDTSDSHLHSPSLVPLHEADAFPALSSYPPTSSNNATKFSSTWTLSEENKDIIKLLRSPQQHAPPKEDEFSRLGLQRLSKEPATTQKSQQIKYISWDSSLQDSDDNASDYEDRDEKLGLNFSSLKQRRPNRNMDRLRDRWWDALALRTAKRNVMVELGNVLQTRIVDPDVERIPETEAPSMHTSSSDSCSNEITEKEEVHTPSSLHLLMQQSKHDNHTSGLDILKSILKVGDREALGELLELHHDKEKETPDGNHSYFHFIENALDWTVRLNQPGLLMVVLIHLIESGVSLELEKISAKNNISIIVGSFFLAAELGHEECLSHFLNKCENTMALLSSKDIDGNSVFHHCCRGDGDTLVLKVLLERLSGGNKNRQQHVSKILLIKNKMGQTALHVACECQRVDFVENFLGCCSTALLAKLLAVEDTKSQTPLLTAVSADASDVVMCLIMWRGNHNIVLRKTPQAPQKWKELKKDESTRAVTPSQLVLPPCPLVWAAKNGNLDMILLLIQCSDPSGGDFHVTEALVALLGAPIDANLKAEGCSLLAHNGGNPFVELPGNDSIHKTVVSIAAKTCESLVLRTLVSAGKSLLLDRQNGRRKDPKLRLQPESFFVSIEAKENFEMERALANTLVQCLFDGWRGSDVSPEENSHEPLVSAVTLYTLGARPKERDILRLHESINARRLKPEMPFSDRKTQRYYSTSYVRLGQPTSKSKMINNLDFGALSRNTLLLTHLDWFRDQMRTSSCSCLWLSELFESESGVCEDGWEDDLAVLVADDGKEFEIHERIVSAMSGKLASALRFDAMKDTTKGNEKRKLQLDMTSETCARFLQHIYHGSIACGWSRGRHQNCCEILELMVVAEEYLCHSLVQECEMRLLSSDPTGCFCCSCSKAVRQCISEDGSNAECVYFVQGPSQLVSSTAVLDILAVLQHLETTTFEYTISEVIRSPSWLQCLSPSMAWRKDGKGWRSQHGMGFLREAAFSCILSSFHQVIQSGSFRESAAINEETDAMNSTKVLHQSVLLLQLCLEELSCLSVQGSENGHDLKV